MMKIGSLVNPEHSERRRSRCVMLCMWLALMICGAVPAWGQAPVNDNFTNAIVISGGAGSYAGNNIFATMELGEPTCYSYIVSGHSVWFKYTPPANGTIVFDTFGSYIDTTLSVFSGTSLNNLTMLACNDDYYWGGGWYGWSWSSLVNFPAQAGVDYYIAVNGYYGDQGPFMLNWYGLTNVNPPVVLGTNQIQFASTSFSVNENIPGFAAIDVVYSGGAPGAVSVDYMTADVSAIDGIDYFGQSGTLTFNNGESNKTFLIPIMDNPYPNSNKTVNLFLSYPTGGATLGSVSNSTLVIVDDETVPPFSTAGEFNFSAVMYEITDYEGYSTPNYRDIPGALITVTRTAGSTGRVLIDYSTVDLTNWFYLTNVSGYPPAYPGSDYVPTSGTLVFDDYQMSAQFIVPIIGYYGGGFSYSNAYYYSVPLVLSNPRPALEEEAMQPGVIAPTLGTNTVSEILIRNSYYYTNTFASRYAIVRANHRVEEDEGGFWLALIGPQGRVGLATYSFSWQGGTLLNAGSDYADGTTRIGPNPAFTDGYGPITNISDYQVIRREISHPGGLVYHWIDIVNDDGVVEFNEDMYMWLYHINGQPALRGYPWDDSILTILTDDEPAGAADRNWNPHGLHFTSPPFNPTPGANNAVNGVAVQADQKSIIGGDFTAFNTVPRNHVARLNQDGSLDLTFEPGTGANGSVSAVGVYPTTGANSNNLNKVIIAGSFTAYNGVLRKGIARLNPDGTLDTTFNPGDGVDFPIRTVVPMESGKVLIGGEFTVVNGVTRNHVARLNDNGTLDMSFDAGTGTDGPVWSIATDDTSSAIQLNAAQSGGFEEYRTNINTGARSGTITLVFYPYCVPDDLRVYYGPTLIFDSGFTNEYRGDLFCDFYNWTGPITYVLPYGPGPYTDVTIVVNEGGGDLGTVWDLEATIENEVAGQRVLVGGEFSSLDGVPRSGIARLNANGALDLTFDPGAGVDGPVYAVAAQNDFKVLIGGRFNDLDFRSRNCIARLNRDGSLDTGYDPGLGFDNPVFAIAMQPDGKAVVGGSFTSYDGVRRIGIARIMTNGVLDTSFMDTAYNQFAGLINTFSFQPPNFINSIALEANGNVLIGGSFTNIGGNSMLPWYHRRTSEYYYQTGTQSFPPWTRADKVPRYNVARLIGGYTPGPGVAELSFPSYTVNEGDAVLNVTLNRVDGRLGTLTGFVTTSNRVAQAGVDYTYSKTVVNWPEYSYAYPRSVGYIGPRYFQVPITDNMLLDGNRLLDLLLVEPTGSITLGGELIPLGGARSRMRTPMSIVDNDFDKGVLTFSSPTYTVNENQAFLAISVIRTNGTDGQVSVSYFTTDGSALSGADYTGKSGTLELKPGTATAVIQIPIFNDTQVELDETFKIVLTNATGGAKLPGGTEVSFDLATVSILDDDFAPGRLSFLTTNFNAMENSGLGTVTVIRNGGNYGSISVDVSATSGTAIAGTDFTAVTTRLQWNSGDTTPRTFNVPLINNNIVDGARTVNLQLSNASTNGALGNRPTATLTIVDDDSFGALSFSQPVYEANENGTNLLVTVVRSGGLAGQVSVDYMVTGGSAVGGQDYNLVPGTLRMVPGQSSATFSIQLLDNAVSDGVRTIQVSLGNILSATNGNFLTTTVLILDNETANEPAGSLDTAFDTGLGANKPVYALALQPDGKLIAAGDFTTLNGVTRHRLGRVLANGSLDATYNVGQGPNRPVRAVALQPDNKLVIAGFFTLVHGTNRNHIARLHEDGTLDAAFDPGSGGDNPIYAVALKNDGKVVVGGSFTTFNGLTRPNIVVLNTNGSVDLSFNPGLGANGTVYAVAVQPDGKILIGGDFTLVNNIQRVRIARFNADGSVDPTFNPGLGADAAVRAILVQADGSIVVGGSFTSIDSVARSYLARLDSQGMVDLSFLESVSGADNAVYALASQADGKLIVVGDFTTFNGVTRNRITRLNVNGTTDPTINFGVGANSFIAAVAIQPDRKIVIGGGFTSFDAQAESYFARLHGGSIVGPGAVEFSTAEYVVDENGTNAVITVLRSGGTTGNVGVQYTTRSGSASAGQDYQDQTGLLTFPEGEVRGTFLIPILQDLLVEAPETVHLTLTNPTGGVALGPQPTATLAIISDDSVVSFLTATFSVNENVNTGNALISVVRTGATNTSVSVEYLTQDGTAIGGLNYIRTRGSMNFAPGEMLKTFSMPIIDNAEPTGNRTVLMTLTNVTANGVLGVSSAILTIVDDDFASGILNFSAPTYTVNEYQTNVTVTVVRTNGSTGIVSVRYSTSDGTARMGQDFMGVNGTLSFADGETVKTFNIPIIPDYINETNETVILALSVPTGGASIGSLSTAILTIINNNLVNGSFSFTETNYASVEGALQARVTVSRSFGALGDVFVTCRTVDGTALGGVDFEAITNALFWPDGDNTPKDFVINLINDSIVEAKESFAVEMLNPTGGATLGLRTNTLVTVSDDDFGPGYLSLASARIQVWENETNAVIKVVRTYGDTGTVSVAYQTLPGGTALPNVNYTNVSGVLTFAPGETNKSFLIPVIDNAVVEVDKTILLEISNPTGGASLLNQITSAVVNLVEDDAQAGSLDMAFGEPNDQVYTVVLQTNRNYLFVGGDFSAINGQPRSRLARFEPNGNWDPSFDVGGAFSGSVRTLAIQNDGKFVVGGSFTNAFSGSNSYLVRLNADASQDTNFFGGLSGVNNLVYAAAVQSDGKVIIGGLFSAVNGTNRNFLARVNANGALDMNFNPAAGTDGAVRAIALQYDGKILIAGDFRTVNGVTRNRIARLEADGTLDMSFDPGFGADDSIRAMVLYLDGRAVIGGLFQSFDGTPRIRVARLGFDGKLDPTFDAGAGANEFVSALAVQPDGKILVGGAFTTFNGIPHQRITRLNENGSVDASINFGQGANNYISTIALQPDRKIVIGGAFTEFDGQRRPYLARLYGGENLGPGSMNFSSTNYLVVENQGKVLVSVRRQIGTTNSVSVNFTTADGSAIAGTHYMPTNGTLNFGPGETVKFFEVVVIDDGVTNVNRTVDLILSDATGGAVLGAQSRAQISVVNDDCMLSFAISQFSVSENAGLADITVQRIGSTVGTVSVDYTMTDNTATAGLDYIRANTTTLTFADGQSSATFAVAVLDDELVEPNEMVDLALSRPAGSAVLGLSAAQLTIVDNDFSTGLFSFSQPNFTATERGGQALVTVTRSGGNAGSAAVNFNTANVEATAGSDYIATNGLLVFADGEISKTFPITILDDALVENRQGEAFEVTLSNPTGAQIGQATATVTILSDEALFSFSQTNYVYFETNVVAMVTVLRGTNGTGPVSVSFMTSNNTAVAGADFVATNGVLNWAANDYTPQTISIPLVNDDIGEPVEDFTVMLLNPTGEALLGMDSITTISILDNDISFSFELANYMVAENATNYSVNVIRTGLSNAAASVNFATSDGTAKARADYVFTSLKLDFVVNEISKQVVIPIIDDTIGEGNEELFLNLAPESTNASVGPPSTATLTIIDNEDSFSLSSTNYVVDESGTNASITVIRSGNPGLLDVVLFYSTTNITAIPGTNYTNVSGPLMFSPGETMKSFNIPVIDDAIAGGDVTVGIHLYSYPTDLRGAVLVPPTNAVLTILDNDVSVGFGDAALVVEEGNTNLVLPVLRNGALSNLVRVAYTTSNGTARAGSDYISTSGMLTFAPGVTNQNIVVSALDDLRIEGNELFSVRLFNPAPTNITLRFGGVLNVTLLDNDTSIIVPSGSAFLTESLTNNGVVDVGETVTLNFGLRNVGNADTINLVATLLPTNGVTSPNPTQRTYGAVLAGGAVLSQPFTFTANAPNGGQVLVTFRLQDIDVPNNWTNNLGTVTFSFVVGRANYSFVNNSPILINDSTNASPYASIIQVSNVVGNITKVTVGINNLSHAFPADIDMLLVNPAGQATILMSDAGGGFPVNSINLSFDDARTNTLPANAEMVSGTYKPTNHMEYIYGIPSVDWFPLPAPAMPWGEGLVALASGNPNGPWQLFVVDDLGGESGNIAGGWTLNLVTSDSGSSSADLSVVASDDADPILIGRNVSYTLAVTNHGPSTSTGVYLTNYLPANVTFVSCSGAYVRTNNMVIVNLGTIGSGFGRAINLVVQPTQVGTVGVMAYVVGSQVDMNLNNNTREVLTDVIPSPTVFMARKDANSMTISWIAAATGFVLESTDSLNPPRWEPVPGTVTPSGGMLTITVNTPGTNRFFRLRQP